LPDRSTQASAFHVAGVVVVCFAAVFVAYLQVGGAVELVQGVDQAINGRLDALAA
jgi:hypothetical protein